MLKALDMIGLPVMEVETGKQLGAVQDLLLNRQNQLKGVLIENKNWFSAVRYVPWKELIAVGDDAITVASKNVLLEWDEQSQLMLLKKGESPWLDLPVLTVNGKQLGRIQDVYFDGKLDKQIVGYELTDGLVSDLTEGRKWLPAPDKIKKGAEAVFVPVQSENQLKDTEPLFQNE